MATLIGAGLSGDWSEIRKAHYTYFSMGEIRLLHHCIEAKSSSLWKKGACIRDFKYKHAIEER